MEYNSKKRIRSGLVIIRSFWTVNKRLFKLFLMYIFVGNLSVILVNYHECIIIILNTWCYRQQTKVNVSNVWQHVSLRGASVHTFLSLDIFILINMLNEKLIITQKNEHRRTCVLEYFILNILCCSFIYIINFKFILKLVYLRGYET